MSEPLVVFKRRTNVVPVSLGFDVSNDILTSEMRTPSGVLIAAWDIEFEGDGTDGELIFTLDDSVASTITHSKGLMDIKRVVNGEPVAVFKDPVEVEFKEPVTV